MKLARVILFTGRIDQMCKFYGEVLGLKLVTSEDVDVSKGMISTSSPIGRGLLGKRVGDTVKIQIPGGMREMEIVELKTIHHVEDKVDVQDV